MKDFNSRFDFLLTQVGRKYQMFNEDGTYQGCFYPVQVLYPDKPKYKMPSENPAKNFLYGLARLKKHCTEIKREDLRKGDIICCEFNNEMHVAIYWEYGKIIHVFREHELFIGKIDMLKLNMSYWRVNV